MGGLISSVVLKVAGRCNLNCSYCYVYNHEDRGFLDRPAFISDDVYGAALRVVRRYAERHDQSLTLIFHGGEPTLIGPERFDQLAARAAAELGPHLRGLVIQTNATLLDGRWATVLRRHHVNVGISIDGPAAVHDLVRVDHAGRGSYDRTIAGLKRLQDEGVWPSVLCVVVPGTSGAAVYREFRSLGVLRMSFLLPDVSHDNKERLYGRFGATPVADYLIPIFDTWLDEDDVRVRVRPFWGIVRALLGGSGETDAFGNPLMSYLIVETDGSIEALDALRVCAHGIASSGLNVLHDDFDDLQRGLPLVHRVIHEGVPLAPQCRVCPECRVCGGGYLPHRYARANGFDNPSVWCADILKLLAHIRSRLTSEGVTFTPATGDAATPASGLMRV